MLDFSTPIRYIQEMEKVIPLGPSLVVMVGPSGAGKSTFIAEHFEPREVVSTDAIRREFTGDHRRHDKHNTVIDAYHRRIGEKLWAGQRVVADATHLRNSERRKVAFIALDYGIRVTYVVVNRPMEQKLKTAGWREGVRVKGKSLIQAHEETFEANEGEILRGDGLRGVTVIDTRNENFRVVQALPRNPELVARELFDRGFRYIRVIGDVHGNQKGLTEALNAHPDTFFLFLGDIPDYGSYTIGAVEEVEYLMSRGLATNLRGNHEWKVFRFITQERGDGFRGTEGHGNAVTFNQIRAMDPVTRIEWEQRFIGLFEMSPDTIEMDDWLFVHAAAHPAMWGNNMFRFHRHSTLETYAIYGETTGRTGLDGFPERLYNWVNKVPPGKTVVVGHAIRSVHEPMVVRGNAGGEVIFLDTGSSKSLDNVPGHLPWNDQYLLHIAGSV